MKPWQAARGPNLHPPLAPSCGSRAPPPLPRPDPRPDSRHASFSEAIAVGQMEEDRQGTGFARLWRPPAAGGAVTAPNRARRGGRRRAARLRGGEPLTRSASPCPARTAAMGKGSSRGHPPPLGSRSHPGTKAGWGAPGVAMATIARPPASLRPARPGAWRLRRVDGRGPGHPGTGMASQSRGWRAEGWGRGWGARPPLGTAGERRRPAPPVVPAAPP